MRPRQRAGVRSVFCIDAGPEPRANGTWIAGCDKRLALVRERFAWVLDEAKERQVVGATSWSGCDASAALRHRRRQPRGTSGHKKLARGSYRVLVTVVETRPRQLAWSNDIGERQMTDTVLARFATDPAIANGPRVLGLTLDDRGRAELKQLVNDSEKALLHAEARAALRLNGQRAPRRASVVISVRSWRGAGQRRTT